MIILLSGCNQTATVKGKVTGDGKVVEGGDIIFRPLEPGVKPAAGSIQGDGTFELKTAGNAGLKPGEYEALYTAPLPKEDDQSMGPPSPWRAWKAPSEPVVIEAGENDISVELVKNK